MNNCLCFVNGSSDVWYNTQAERAWDFAAPLYGTPKSTQISFMAQKDFYVGWAAQSKRGMLTLTKLYQETGIKLGIHGKTLCEFY
jgi:hypothetical protein